MPFFCSLQDRINSMETAIVTTANSLDNVLEKLNKQHKDQRRIGRKEMDSIFDNIVNGEGGTSLLDK